MSKTINTYKKECKLFGITIFSSSEAYYEISTEDNSPDISDEVILQERIQKIRESEKRWWFK